MNFVSVIIPCRNEEKHIAKCLDTLLEQDYPHDNLEILVVDGASKDKSKEIVQGYSQKHAFVKLLDNPHKFTPHGLNIGIKNAKGDVILRMDAHASYQKDYISKCVKLLQESGADNVGGIMKTMPAKNTPQAKAIAISLSHFFGAASSFRKGVRGPTFVDTVFGGCYKKEVFEKVGLFNESLIRSQDIEFNKRLKDSGGKILMAPDIVSYYYPKADLLSFLHHNFIDGFWTTYPLKFGIKFFSLRHLIPLFFVSWLFLTFFLSFFLFWPKLLFTLTLQAYIVAAFFLSFLIAVRRGINLFPYLVFAFVARHFGYGLGSLWGGMKSIKELVENSFRGRYH